MRSLDVEALIDAVADRVAARVLDRLQHQQQEQPTDSDRWLSSAEAAAYLGMTTNALHKLTSARTIPFEQDAPGGRLYFKRTDLDDWRRGKR